MTGHGRDVGSPGSDHDDRFRELYTGHFDALAERGAVSALQASHGWKILDEMNAEGDYPEVVWGYADAIAAGKPLEGAKTASEPADGFKQALGCD
jgi:hypothetical protein